MPLGLEVINRSPDELPQENTFANVLQRRRMLQALTPPMQVQPSVEEQYMQEVQNYPKYTNAEGPGTGYQPTRLRKVLGAIAGLSGVPGSQRAVTDAPYYQSLIPYQQRLGALKTGAEFSMLQDKARAERFKNVMQGRQYGAESEANMALAAQRKYEMSPEYQQYQERLKRAALGYQGYGFPGQGKIGVLNRATGAVQPIDVAPPDTRGIEEAKIAANARIRAAQITAEAHKSIANAKPAWISPEAWTTAYNQAMQEVMNETPAAKDYWDKDSGTLIYKTTSNYGFGRTDEEDEALFGQIVIEVNKRAQEIANMQRNLQPNQGGKFGKYKGGRVR